MNLEETLIDHLNSLALIRFSHSFGWKCIYVDKRMIGGYKVVDDNIMLIFLILSPDKFKDSIEKEFTKFEFGQTWVETEINGEDDLPRIEPFIMDALNYSKTRSKKTKKPE